MDLALALWYYDPSSAYRLNSANADKYEDIIEWRGPAPKPTKEQVEQCWADYLVYESENQPNPTTDDRVSELESEILLLKEDIKALKEKP